MKCIFQIQWRYGLDDWTSSKHPRMGPLLLFSNLLAYHITTGTALDFRFLRLYTSKRRLRIRSLAWKCMHKYHYHSNVQFHENNSSNAYCFLGRDRITSIPVVRFDGDIYPADSSLHTYPSSLGIPADKKQILRLRTWQYIRR